MKKGYLAKTTAEKASVGPKLSKYNRGNDFRKIFFLPFFSPSRNFFQFFFSEKIPTWRTRPADTRGGHPRVGGWNMRAKTPATLSAGFFRKNLLEPPWTPPWTPHFFQFFFSVLDHRSPLLYFFLLLYYCVPLYIFTVFVHFFFNNQVQSGSFTTTAIFFFYYITVFPFIFSLFLFTFFFNNRV